MAAAEASAPSLSELLQRGWDAQRRVEKGELSSGSLEFKVGYKISHMCTLSTIEGHTSLLAEETLYCLSLKFTYLPPSLRFLDKYFTFITVDYKLCMAELHVHIHVYGYKVYGVTIHLYNSLPCPQSLIFLVVYALSLSLTHTHLTYTCTYTHMHTHMHTHTHT